jgi:two-component system sensor histidine kinase ChiS
LNPKSLGLFKNISSIRNYLVFSFLIVIIPFITFANLYDYSIGQNLLQSDIQELQNHIEDNVVRTIKTVDDGLKAFEKQFESNMNLSLHIISQEYISVGNNASNMNLTKLYHEFLGKYEIYIINQSGIVQFSTYEADVGFNFALVNRLEFITNLRETKNFEVGRITPEFISGSLKKFAYLPSPDRKYVFEIGLLSNEFAEDLQHLNYIKSAEEIKKETYLLSDINIFDRNAHLIGNSTYNADKQQKEIISSVYQNKTFKEIFNTTTLQLVKYIFMDLYDPNYYLSQPSVVVEFSFDYSIVFERQQNFLFSHILFIIIAISLIILVIIYLATKISSPIYQIINDINEISEGNLSKKIIIDTKNEFKLLEKSINGMITKLSQNVELTVTNKNLEHFAYTISHDLRSPLNKIAEFTNMIIKSDTSLENIRILDKINNLVHEMNQIIIDLLNYSQIKNFDLNKEFRTIKTENVLKEAIKLNESLIHSKKGLLEYEPIPDIKGNYALIMMLFQNLINNAIKFNNSEIPTVIIKAEEKNKRIHFSIQDNGIGISDEFASEVFTMFSREYPREEFNGTGIGLVSCKRIVEIHGGSISFNSVKGEGTTFFFSLPSVNSD